MNKQVKDIFEDVCTLTKDMGTCKQPDGHKYMVTPNVKKGLNDICALKNKDPTKKQVLEAFTSIEQFTYKMAKCGSHEEKYQIRGNIHNELSGIRHKIRMLPSKYSVPPLNISVF